MKKRITIQDIVQKTGISKSTVSRVLTGKGYVANETKEIILNAMNELEYVPQKKHSINDMVMIVSCQIDSDAQIKLSKSISSTLQDKGYKTMIASVEFGSDTIYNYLDYACEKNFGGVIILGALETRELRYSLMNMNCPIVLLNQSITGIPTCSLILEDKKAGYDATKYLISNGHKRILFLTGYDNATAISAREEGFLQAIQEANIEDLSKIERTDFTKDSGKDIAYKLIENHFPFTAVICATDELLSGMLSIFRKEKVKIPDDISIMSFENTVLTEIYDPSITVVGYDFIEIGNQMANLLIERLGKPYTRSSSIKCYSTLVVRDSVKKIS